MSFGVSIFGRNYQMRWLIYPFLAFLVFFSTSKPLISIPIIGYYNDSPKYLDLVVSKTDPDSARYMLSTLVQSEATILAVIFTLSIVAVQLAASSYSPRVMDIFKKMPDFWILMITYIFAMIIGINTLKNIDNMKIAKLEWLIILSYQTSIFAFLAPIPYMWNLIDLLRPSILIEKLSQGITKDSLLGTDHMGDEKDPIQPTTDITIGALIKYDEGTMLYGLKAIESRVKFVFNTEVIESHREIDIAKIIYHHLLIISDVSMNRADEFSTVQIFNCIGRTGIIAIENSLQGVATEAISLLEQLGIKAIELNQEKASIQATSSLRDLGLAAADKGLPGATAWAVARLSTIGTKAAEMKLVDTTVDVTFSLELIGAKSLETIENFELPGSNVRYLSDANRFWSIETGFLKSSISDAAIQATAAIGAIGLMAVKKEQANIVKITLVSLESLHDIAKNYRKENVKCECIKFANEIHRKWTKAS